LLISPGNQDKAVGAHQMYCILNSRKPKIKAS